MVCRQQGGESPEAARDLNAANGAAATDAAAGVHEEQSPLLEGVCFHALESRNDGILWDCAPACVIMYDSDVAIVRQLEVRDSYCCLCHPT